MQIVTALRLHGHPHPVGVHAVREPLSLNLKMKQENKLTN